MRLLVAAALRVEAVAVALSAGRRALPPAGGTTTLLERPGRAVHLLRTGIGPAAARASLDRALADLRPTAVLNVGWAGGLHDSLPVGALLVARRFLDGDGDGVLPADGGDLTAWLSRAAEPLGARRVDLVTVSRLITRPEDKRALLCRTGAWACEMEGFAVASACGVLGVPVASLRVVSDGASHAPPFGDPGRARTVVSHAASHALGVMALVPLVRALRRAFADPEPEA